MRRALLLAAGGVAILGCGLLALPSHATAMDTCPPDGSGKLTSVSPPVVPIGVPAVRSFTIDVQLQDVTVTNVAFSATNGVQATQSTTASGYDVKLTAPRAGAFQVKATWTQQTARGGTPCSAAGAVAYTATAGAPLRIVPPPSQRSPGSTARQVDNPVYWTWKCSAGTDPTPPSISVRWEVDMRPLPAYSKGGHEPFRFTKKAKSFAVRGGDACRGKAVKGRHPLMQGASLEVRVAGGGYVWMQLRGGFRNPHGDKAPFHLGVTVRQGKRTLVDTKLCAWYENGYLIAKGSGISCWW